jgi:hypothetical protein
MSVTARLGAPPLDAASDPFDHLNGSARAVSDAGHGHVVGGDAVVGGEGDHLAQRRRIKNQNLERRLETKNIKNGFKPSRAAAARAAATWSWKYFTAAAGSPIAGAEIYASSHTHLPTPPATYSPQHSSQLSPGPAAAGPAAARAAARAAW